VRRIGDEPGASGDLVEEPDELVFGDAERLAAVDAEEVLVGRLVGEVVDEGAVPHVGVGHDAGALEGLESPVHGGLVDGRLPVRVGCAEAARDVDGAQVLSVAVDEGVDHRSPGARQAESFAAHLVEVNLQSLCHVSTVIGGRQSGPAGSPRRTRYLRIGSWQTSAALRSGCDATPHRPACPGPADVVTGRIPSRVEVEEQSRVVLTWEDGEQTTLSASQLRGACHCATCREPAGMEKTRLVLAGPVPVTITDTRIVGGYALTFVFGPDGHGTGIYPYDRLYDLGGA